MSCAFWKINSVSKIGGFPVYRSNYGWGITWIKIVDWVRQTFFQEMYD